MSRITSDPLLTLARAGTILVQIFLIISQIGLGIAMVLAVIGALGFIPADVGISAVAELPRGAMWLAALAMFLMLVGLGLTTDFTVRLRQIIDTVGQGDPFVLDNANRLTRMGWLALIVQLTMLAAAMVAAFAGARFGESVFELKVEVSLYGFVLAIVLFILARVFRKGAEMREELEGTV